MDSKGIKAVNFNGINPEYSLKRLMLKLKLHYFGHLMQRAYSMEMRASFIAQLVKNPPAMQETLVRFLVRKICWRWDRLPTPVFLGFPCGSADKESTCSSGDLGSIPGLGRFLGEGKGYPLQYSAWRIPYSIVCEVTKSWTRLSDFHFYFSYQEHVSLFTCCFFSILQIFAFC